jgi:antitoxin FitA
MRGACYGANRMSKNVQVRNVSDATHRALKERAAREGRTISDLVSEELDRMVQRPSRREVFERIRSHGYPPLDEPPADTVRRMRDDVA